MPSKVWIVSKLLIANAAFKIFDVFVDIFICHWRCKFNINFLSPMLHSKLPIKLHGNLHNKQRCSVYCFFCHSIFSTQQTLVCLYKNKENCFPGFFSGTFFYFHMKMWKNKKNVSVCCQFFCWFDNLEELGRVFASCFLP